MGFASVLSDLAAQSDKTVSRETFWYDWRGKTLQGLRQRPGFYLVRSIELLVQLSRGGSGSTERPVGGRWLLYPFRSNQLSKTTEYLHRNYAPKNPCNINGQICVQNS
jgi:hypothetical protein